MSRHSEHTSSHKHQTQDFESLAEDARALMVATADVTGNKVAEVRQRLSDSLANVRDRVIERANSADKAVRESPYQALGIALGLGVLIGWYVTRRSSRTE
jgi:ElaB/YqjD/DUF883 family membrane-anchored ribosome-binding protein